MRSRAATPLVDQTALPTRVAPWIRAYSAITLTAWLCPDAKYLPSSFSTTSSSMARCAPCGGSLSLHRCGCSSGSSAGSNSQHGVVGIALAHLAVAGLLLQLWLPLVPVMVVLWLLSRVMPTAGRTWTVHSFARFLSVVEGRFECQLAGPDGLSTLA